MDIKLIAQRHLEDALRYGYVRLVNGEIKDLKGNEILSVAKYVLKEGTPFVKDAEPVDTFPDDILQDILKNSED